MSDENNKLLKLENIKLKEELQLYAQYTVYLKTRISGLNPCSSPMSIEQFKKYVDNRGDIF